VVQKQTTHDPAFWDDLRYALVLAKAGSVRHASRTLGVSHSTVLRRLATLESRLGVRLFERTPDGYATTAAGQEVFDTASSVADLVSGLERRIQGRDLQLAGPVRITLPDPLLHPLLPVLDEIHRRHPDIELTVVAGAAYADLAYREADIALRVTSEPSPELVGRRICNVASGVYGSTRYLKGRNTRDLAKLDWIRFEVGSQMYYETWIATHVPDARTALRVSTAWALEAAVDRGLGVTALPCPTGDARPGWKRIHLFDEPPTPLWILTHRDLRSTARIRVLRDLLAEALIARRALFEGRSKQQ
jgi:DNA-binding transcriptional LysR family regulator